MLEAHENLLPALLKGLKLVTHRKVMMTILDAIEHLCRLDIGLQLSEEKFKDAIEASEGYELLNEL